MYLRFVVPETDEELERPLGVLNALFRLRRDGKLYRHEEEHLNSIARWFNQNLEQPTRFTAAKPPFYRKKSRALSWFKDSAREHIARNA